jgi:hypothetical protein
LIERSCHVLPFDPLWPTAVSDEREHLAAALCETAVRAMFAVTLKLAAIDAVVADVARAELGVAIDAVDTAIREMRRLIFAMPQHWPAEGIALVPVLADTRSPAESGRDGTESTSLVGT